MNKLKIIIFISVFAIGIVTNINYITVYAMESKYSLIWLWASKSIINVHQFYYIAFLLNCLVCIIFLLIPVLLSKSLQKNISRFFWLLIIPTVILSLWPLAGFIVFDLEVFPFGPPDYVEQGAISSQYTDAVYCDYWSFGVNNDYLSSALCDRPN